MCNLSWTPHSNIEKDNSLKTTPVLAQRWAVWSILTKNTIFFYNYKFRDRDDVGACCNIPLGRL